MKIAYVLRVFPKLSETFIAAELAELRRRGVELRILSLGPPRESLRHSIVERAGLDAIYDEGRFLPELRAFRPDLLHAHFATEATAAARELAAAVGLPFTFTAHGYDIYRRPPADWAERAAAAAAVVTVSEANADHINRIHGVPRAHVRVIPSGVDVRWIVPAPPADRAQPPHVVCVARLVEVKNVGLLLRACADLRDLGLQFRCIVVGEGRCRDELEGLRRELGLEDVVQLVGAAAEDEVLAWWRRATVAALPSVSEGLPVSLLEAGACAVPAVATAVGGVPELVVDGRTGILVPANDVGAFTNALARLIDDPAAAARMGAAARRRIEQRFDVRLQVDRLLALWREVVAGAAAA